LREPNMKMCTLVVYPGPLRFSRVMPIWTWKFDTSHRALCHHNSSHMLNQMFVKLSILQDPNMKMGTLVPYPRPLSFLELCPKLCTCTFLDSNVQLCAFKHKNLLLDFFYMKYGFGTYLVLKRSWYPFEFQGQRSM
jgi:hypothetical protein